MKKYFILAQIPSCALESVLNYYSEKGFDLESLLQGPPVTLTLKGITTIKPINDISFLVTLSTKDTNKTLPALDEKILNDAIKKIAFNKDIIK